MSVRECAMCGGAGRNHARWCSARFRLRLVSSNTVRLDSLQQEPVFIGVDLASGPAQVVVREFVQTGPDVSFTEAPWPRRRPSRGHP